MNFLKKFIIQALLCTLTISRFSFGEGTPESIQIKVNSIAFSASDLCTNPITLTTNNTPVYDEFCRDIDNLPVLAEEESALNPDGYPCVIVCISDNVVFMPPEAGELPNCTGGTSYVQDYCQSGTSYDLWNSSTGAYETHSCRGSQASPVEDNVCLYISTKGAGVGSGGNPFQPPIVGPTIYGVQMPFKFTIDDTSAGSTGFFVINAGNKVIGDDSSGECILSQPQWEFKNYFQANEGN